MCEKISAQQNHLKVHQACVPDGRRAPEDGQDHLADHRLHREQQRRAKERVMPKRTTTPNLMDHPFQRSRYGLLQFAQDQTRCPAAEKCISSLAGQYNIICDPGPRMPGLYP